MRWEALFADLEAQAEALENAERAAQVEELVRGEIAELSVLDRLRAALGAPLRLRTTTGITVTGTLSRVGPDWLLIDEGAGRETVVVLSAVLDVSGLGRFSAGAGSVGLVTSRLGLRHALRGIARDRSTVRLHLASDRTELGVRSATIDRVGSDFVELAVHPPGESRRRDEVRDVLLVPFSALVALSREV
jgi:hypothetical protein